MYEQIPADTVATPRMRSLEEASVYYNQHSIVPVGYHFHIYIGDQDGSRCMSLTPGSMALSPNGDASCNVLYHACTLKW